MADGVTPPGPKSAAERIDAIDVLRGIALLGVLAINVVNEFRVSIFEQFLFQKPASSTIDRAIEAILALAVEMKAFALFSMLFGVGPPSSSSGLRIASTARSYSYDGLPYCWRSDLFIFA